METVNESLTNTNARVILKFRIDGKCKASAHLNQTFYPAKTKKKVNVFDDFLEKRQSGDLRAPIAIAADDVSSPFEEHRILREFQLSKISGTYIQCSNSACKKYTFSKRYADPSQVPMFWTCAQANNKDILMPNNFWPNEEKFCATKFTPGSLVWTKTPGHPWWPGMIDYDVDTQEFYWLDGPESVCPDWYHVIFFDKGGKVSRQWTKKENMKSFKEEDCDLNAVMNNLRLKESKVKADFRHSHSIVIEMVPLNLYERLEKFSFLRLYKGKWGVHPRKGKLLLKQQIEQEQELRSKRKEKELRRKEARKRQMEQRKQEKEMEDKQNCQKEEGKIDQKKGQEQIEVGHDFSAKHMEQAMEEQETEVQERAAGKNTFAKVLRTKVKEDCSSMAGFCRKNLKENEETLAKKKLSSSNVSSKYIPHHQQIPGCKGEESISKISSPEKAGKVTLIEINCTDKEQTDLITNGVLQRMSVDKDKEEGKAVQIEEAVVEVEEASKEIKEPKTRDEKNSEVVQKALSGKESSKEFMNKKSPQKAFVEIEVQVTLTHVEKVVENDLTNSKNHSEKNPPQKLELWEDTKKKLQSSTNVPKETSSGQQIPEQSEENSISKNDFPTKMCEVTHTEINWTDQELTDLITNGVLQRMPVDKDKEEEKEVQIYEAVVEVEEPPKEIKEPKTKDEKHSEVVLVQKALSGNKRSKEFMNKSVDKDKEEGKEVQIEEGVVEVEEAPQKVREPKTKDEKDSEVVQKTLCGNERSTKLMNKKSPVIEKDVETVQVTLDNVETVVENDLTNSKNYSEKNTEKKLESQEETKKKLLSSNVSKDTSPSQQIPDQNDEDSISKNDFPEIMCKVTHTEISCPDHGFLKRKNLIINGVLWKMSVNKDKEEKAKGVQNKEVVVEAKEAQKEIKKSKPKDEKKSEVVQKVGNKRSNKFTTKKSSKKVIVKKTKRQEKSNQSREGSKNLVTESKKVVETNKGGPATEGVICADIEDSSDSSDGEALPVIEVWSKKPVSENPVEQIDSIERQNLDVVMDGLNKKEEQKNFTVEESSKNDLEMREDNRDNSKESFGLMNKSRPMPSESPDASKKKSSSFTPLQEKEVEVEKPCEDILRCPNKVLETQNEVDESSSKEYPEIWSETASESVSCTPDLSAYENDFCDDLGLKIVSVETLPKQFWQDDVPSTNILEKNKNVEMSRKKKRKHRKSKKVEEDSKFPILNGVFPLNRNESPQWKRLEPKSSSETVEKRISMTLKRRKTNDYKVIKAMSPTQPKRKKVTMEIETPKFQKPPLTAKMLVVLSIQNLVPDSVTKVSKTLVTSFIANNFPFFEQKMQLLKEIVDKIIPKEVGFLGQIKRDTLWEVWPSMKKVLGENRGTWRNSMRVPYLLDRFLSKCIPEEKEKIYLMPDMRLEDMILVAKICVMQTKEAEDITAMDIKTAMQAIFPFCIDPKQWKKIEEQNYKMYFEENFDSKKLVNAIEAFKHLEEKWNDHTFSNELYNEILYVLIRTWDNRKMFFKFKKRDKTGQSQSLATTSKVPNAEQLSSTKTLERSQAQEVLNSEKTKNNFQSLKKRNQTSQRQISATTSKEPSAEKLSSTKTYEKSQGQQVSNPEKSKINILASSLSSGNSPTAVKENKTSESPNSSEAVQPKIPIPPAPFPLVGTSPSEVNNSHDYSSKYELSKEETLIACALLLNAYTGEITTPKFLNGTKISSWLNRVCSRPKNEWPKGLFFFFDIELKTENRLKVVKKLEIRSSFKYVLQIATYYKLAKEPTLMTDKNVLEVLNSNPTGWGDIFAINEATKYAWPPIPPHLLAFIAIALLKEVESEGEDLLRLYQVISIVQDLFPFYASNENLEKFILMIEKHFVIKADNDISPYLWSIDVSCRQPILMKHELAFIIECLPRNTWKLFCTCPEAITECFSSSEVMPRRSERVDLALIISMIHHSRKNSGTALGYGVSNFKSIAESIAKYFPMYCGELLSKSFDDCNKAYLEREIFRNSIDGMENVLDVSWLVTQLRILTMDKPLLMIQLSRFFDQFWTFHTFHPLTDKSTRDFMLLSHNLTGHAHSVKEKSFFMTKLCKKQFQVALLSKNMQSYYQKVKDLLKFYNDLEFSESQQSQCMSRMKAWISSDSLPEPPRQTSSGIRLIPISKLTDNSADEDRGLSKQNDVSVSSSMKSSKPFIMTGSNSQRQTADVSRHPPSSASNTVPNIIRKPNQNQSLPVTNKNLNNYPNLNVLPNLEKLVLQIPSTSAPAATIRPVTKGVNTLHKLYILRKIPSVPTALPASTSSSTATQNTSQSERLSPRRLEEIQSIAERQASKPISSNTSHLPNALSEILNGRPLTEVAKKYDIPFAPLQTNF